MPAQMHRTLTQIQTIYQKLGIAFPADLLKELEALHQEKTLRVLTAEDDSDDAENETSILEDKLETFHSTLGLHDNPSKVLVVLQDLFAMLNDPLITGAQFENLAAVRTTISAQINTTALQIILTASASDPIEPEQLLLVFTQVLPKPALYVHLQSDTLYALDKYLRNRLKILTLVLAVKTSNFDFLRSLPHYGITFNTQELQLILDRIKSVLDARGQIEPIYIGLYKEFFTALDDDAKAYLLGSGFETLMLLTLHAPEIVDNLKPNDSRIVTEALYTRLANFNVDIAKYGATELQSQLIAYLNCLSLLLKSVAANGLFLDDKSLNAERLLQLLESILKIAKVHHDLKPIPYWGYQPIASCLRKIIADVTDICSILASNASMIVDADKNNALHIILGAQHLAIFKRNDLEYLKPLIAVAIKSGCRITDRNANDKRPLDILMSDTKVSLLSKFAILKIVLYTGVPAKDIAEVLTTPGTNDNDYQRLAAMLLLAAIKPALPIEDLEDILYNAVYNQKDFSPMLICSVIDHLGAHSEWNNRALIIRGKSLWPIIAANKQLKVLQHFPRYASMSGPPLYLELYLSDMFATAFSMQRNRRIMCQHTISIAAADDETLASFFNNHYVSYESLMELSTNFITYLMTEPIALKSIIDELTNTSMQENRSKIGNFVMDLMHNSKFVAAWQSQQHPQSLLCLVRLAALARNQKLDFTVQSNFEDAIQQSLESVIANLDKLTKGPEEENTLVDLKILLDHLYAYYNPLGFEKRLFRSAINALLQRYSTDSDVLDKLKIYEDYGMSVSLGTVRTMQFCSNTRALQAADGMLVTVIGQATQHLSDGARERLSPS